MGLGARTFGALFGLIHPDFALTSQDIGVVASRGKALTEVVTISTPL